MLLTKCSRWLLPLLLLTISWTQAKSLTHPGVRASNVLGGLQQHASFSFVRPGLTQTAFAFNGPSSHQTFSSSIGDPHLASKVQPNLAHALAYRNPGLGFTSFGNGPIATGYATGSSFPTTTAYHQYQPQTQQYQNYDYQQQQQQYNQQYQQALALAYQQQLQQYQLYQQQQQQQPQQQVYPGFGQQATVDSTAAAQQQAHLSQLLASRYAAQESIVPEQIQLQQQVQQQEQQQEQQQQSTANLLGVAYSAAPSVAHVKVNGNGYKFDF